MESQPDLSPLPFTGRTRFIEHAARRIVLMDFSHLPTAQDALPLIEEARLFVAAQPKAKTLLTLVDVAGSPWDTEVIERLKALAKHDEPWVLAGSIVGLNAFTRVLLRIISTFTGRKFGTFKTREDAMDWLVRQKVPPTEVPQADVDAP